MKNHFSFGLCAAAVALSVPALANPSTDKLVAGDSTPHGATLIAGSRGAVYDLRGGAHLTLTAGSEYAFDPSLHLKIRKPGEPDTLARALRLAHGRADVVIPANVPVPTAVFLRGPGKLTAVAKEGTSTFVVEGDRSTAASREGDMLVGIGNDWKPLHQGFARTLAPDDPTALPHSILGAPSASLEHPLVVTNGSGPASVAVSWAALAGATTYDVAVTRVDGGGVQVPSHQLTHDTKATLDALFPGSYAVSVAALDRSGLPGAASDARTIRVVGVEVPPGAVTTTDGTIVMGKDQSISLVGAEGLQVSFGESTLFGSVRGNLSLAHGMPTTARLRVPGTAEETVLHLEPKGLRARVDIGPKLARWPLDRVAIEIDLYDATGRPVPDDATVDPAVTVNLDPVQVAWERTGHTLRGSLPASTTPGPWVVRTEVKDDQGNLIGRNFLEVDRVTTPSGPVVARR